MAAPAAAQTLTLMKGIDAPHYDAQRTTWGPTSDIVNMFQDTLVALDWDGKTPIPYLAKSWTVTPDGKLYTFKLRDDVTFCSGKKFTADDVVYSFKRLTSPELFLLMTEIEGLTPEAYAGWLEATLTQLLLA